MTKKPEARTTESEMLGDVSRLRGWRRARHRADAVNTKVPTRRVTINLDEDVLAIFKAEAFLGGPPYQVAVNQALRCFLRDREQSGSERAAETVLKALDEQAVVRKLRRVIKASAA